MNALPWRERLRREAILTRGEDFDLCYHVSLHPAYPPDYDLPGIVGITFRLDKRPQGGHVYVTALDPAAVLRLGQRLDLDAATAFAMLDSHERIHIELQLAGVEEDVEEERSRFVDAVWLSLRHPRAAHLLEDRPIALVTHVAGVWEALTLDPA